MNGPLVKPGRQLLVIGAGYTGLRLARAARQRGLTVRLTSRRPRQGEDPDQELGWLQFDSASEPALVPATEALAGITDVLVSVPPVQGKAEPNLELLGPLLRQLPL